MPRRLLMWLILMLGLVFQCLSQSAPLRLCKGGSCGTTLNGCCCVANLPGPAKGVKACVPPCGCVITMATGLPLGSPVAAENVPPAPVVATPPPVLAVVLALATPSPEGEPALPGPTPAFGPPPYFEGAALRAPPGLLN